jgi:hypothetical protein
VGHWGSQHSARHRVGEGRGHLARVPREVSGPHDPQEALPHPQQDDGGKEGSARGEEAGPEDLGGGAGVLWFMTRFESRGAHGCGEQWNARDTRVYTGSGLREEKNPTSYVHQLYYDCLG